MGVLLVVVPFACFFLFVVTCLLLFRRCCYCSCSSFGVVGVCCLMLSGVVVDVCCRLSSVVVCRRSLFGVA